MKNELVHFNYDFGRDEFQPLYYGEHYKTFMCILGKMNIDSSGSDRVLNIYFKSQIMDGTVNFSLHSIKKIDIDRDVIIGTNGQVAKIELTLYLQPYSKTDLPTRIAINESKINFGKDTKIHIKPAYKNIGPDHLNACSDPIDFKRHCDSYILNFPG